ncbi:DNA polymerase I [Candidatus Parcubacteria bacterium]|jgi:DNA polymerase-1|nr:MAG: DNA polymerase I [Candidatus Parcubacteria bacterium]
MSSAKVLLVDGNAIIHRSFHALPPLTTKDGTMVNAVYGFAIALLKALKEIKPSHVVVAFDKKGPTFRDELYEQYKATRVQAAQELYDQIPLAHELVAAFNFPVVEADGVEADDVIGTLARKITKTGDRAVILTGDMDTVQLVSDKVSVFSLRKGLSDTVLYTPKEVKERYGFGPEQIIDYKALRGDPSDNIPGVKGVGEKIATDLILKFQSIDNLYRILEHQPKKAKNLPEKLKLKLLNEKEQAYLSKKLATIKLDVPLEFDLAASKVKNADAQKLHDLFIKWEFKSLVGKITQLVNEPEAELAEVSRKTSDQGVLIGRAKEKVDYKLVETEADFKKLLSELKARDFLVLDTETSSLNVFDAKLLGISFAWLPKKAFYVPVTNKKWLAKLKPILENQKIKKWGHNLKYDAKILELAGIKLANQDFDSMVASYLLNAGSRSHDLDTLAFTEFGHQMIPIENLIGKKGKGQLNMSQVPTPQIAEYSGEDADYTLRLCKKFASALEQQKLIKLFQEIEMPLLPVLEKIELNGVKIDSGFLKSLSRKLTIQLKQLEARIKKIGGEDLNVNSPKQLKEVLFNRLKLSVQGIKKTKTGISTAAGELEKLQGLHPIIDLILDYRELQKLLSTYIDALPALVQKPTGRVHTDFNQTVAATGRLSSSNPNLQNIPIRTELGRQIRKAFIAEDGYKLISADYSQIELRIVASLADEKQMIEAFKAGADIHRATAAEIFGVPPEKITDEQRDAAKEVNFGVLYGMGIWGLASRKKISTQHARDFIDRYFATRPNVQKFLEVTKTLARQTGYVQTLFGRKRFMPEMNSSMPQVRAAAERMAVNFPIQGTAADLLKLAMIEVDKGLAKISPRTKMILTVHDELVFETPDSEVDKVAKFVRGTMDNVYKLKVPIAVEVKAGENWEEMEKLSL